MPLRPQETACSHPKSSFIPLRTIRVRKPQHRKGIKDFAALRTNPNSADVTDFGATTREQSDSDSVSLTEHRLLSIKKDQLEKKLLILIKSGLHRYEVYVFDRIVQEKYLPFPIKEMRRTLDEIINIIRYVFSISICYEQSTRGNLFLIINFI